MDLKNNNVLIINFMEILNNIMLKEQQYILKDIFCTLKNNNYKKCIKIYIILKVEKKNRKNIKTCKLILKMTFKTVF